MNQPPLSVLFLASELGPSSASSQLRRLALAFLRDRYHIEIVVCGSCDESIAETLRSEGIAVHHAPVRHLFDIGGSRKLRQLVASLQPSIIHARGTTAARLSRLLVKANADRGNTPPVIVSDAATALGGVSGWLVHRALRHADRIVPTSRAEGERYHRLGVLSERLTRIAPGVSPPDVLPDGDEFRRELGLPPDSRLIFTAGRLESGMPLKSAIWGFDMLRYEAPDLHLVIFGDGPDRTALEEFGHALAFDDFRVHFAGARSNLPELLGLAEVVWVTNDDVTLALEAMAAGRPVVGWHSAELAEIVEDGATGFLAAPGERAQLASKTYPLLHEPGLAARLGAAGRVRALEHFSVTKAVEQFGRLYGELTE